MIITSKSKTRKFYFIASAVVLFIAAGVFAYQYFSELYQISKAEQGNKDLRDEVVNISSDMPVDYDDYLLDSDGSSDKEYVSPIDFKKLKQKNNDAIAWLTISDTEFSFPLMHHKGDNAYYLNRNFDNEWSVYGAAYIEDYNSDDLSDTAIVVYGHNIKNSEWFGEFQTIYTDKEQFKRSQTIKMYLPDEERTYRVFAAVPHTNEHLLEAYDFDKPKDYNTFINRAVSSRMVNGITDKDEIPEAGTPLLILSSCLKGDSSHRFLVLAYQCQ
ncbi:MAG: class B sortase [Clostridia bacterium]|nr:class B sortase [Clostridia bacterium]